MNSILLAAILSQIVVPDTSPPFEPIFARCSFVPGVNQRVAAFTWSSDPDTKYRPVTTDAVNGVPELDIWARPGEHWLKCQLVVDTIKVEQVWIADENDPTNKDKMTLQTREYRVRTEVKEWNSKYSVTDAPRPPPPPEPKPPEPKPPDPPPPTPGKISVLIVEETELRPKLSREQYGAIFGEQFREYIKTHGEARILDPDDDMQFELPKWQKAMAEFKKITPPPELPCALVSNGKDGDYKSIPRSASLTVLMDFLKKWGGP